MNTNGEAERYSDEEKEQYIDAVHEADGIVRHACRILDVAPSTFYARLKRWDELAQELQEARGNSYAELTSTLMDIALGRADEEGIDRQWAFKKALETLSDKVSDGLDWTDRERVEHTGEAPSLPEYASVDEVQEQLEESGLELPEHTDPHPNGDSK